MTHTLEVTEVDDDLLQLLDQRASQQAQDRSAYVRDLLQRALEEEELNEFAVEFVHKVRREKREQKAAQHAVQQEAG